MFLQNSVPNYELQEISVICQKFKENNNLTKFSHRLT